MKTVWLLVAFLSAVASLAQGTINFNTRFAAAGVNAPVDLLSPPGHGPGPAYSAALYLVNPNRRLTLIPTSLTTFRDGSKNPLFAKYVEAVTAEVPGALPGSSVTVVMRAWLTGQGSYEQALDGAESLPFLVQNLGGGPNPPADLPSSFTGFVFMPEPSVATLGILGAVVLFAARRARR